MPDEIERVLFSEAQIAQRVRELGQQISHDYAKLLGEKLAHEPPIAVGLLRGAVVFLAGAREIAQNSKARCANNARDRAHTLRLPSGCASWASRSPTTTQSC
jgi:hypothetical protein